MFTKRRRLETNTSVLIGRSRADRLLDHEFSKRSSTTSRRRRLIREERARREASALKAKKLEEQEERRRQRRVEMSAAASSTEVKNAVDALEVMARHFGNAKKFPKVIKLFAQLFEAGHFCQGNVRPFLAALLKLSEAACCVVPAGCDDTTRREVIRLFESNFVPLLLSPTKTTTTTKGTTKISSGDRCTQDTSVPRGDAGHPNGTSDERGRPRCSHESRASDEGRTIHQIRSAEIHGGGSYSADGQHQQRQEGGGDAGHPTTTRTLTTASGSRDEPQANGTTTTTSGIGGLLPVVALRGRARELVEVCCITGLYCNRLQTDDTYEFNANMAKLSEVFSKIRRRRQELDEHEKEDTGAEESSSDDGCSLMTDDDDDDEDDVDEDGDEDDVDDDGRRRHGDDDNDESSSSSSSMDIDNEDDNAEVEFSEKQKEKGHDDPRRRRRRRRQRRREDLHPDNDPVSGEVANRQCERRAVASFEKGLDEDLKDTENYKGDDTCCGDVEGTEKTSRGTGDPDGIDKSAEVARHDEHDNDDEHDDDEVRHVTGTDPPSRNSVTEDIGLEVNKTKGHAAEGGISSVAGGPVVSAKMAKIPSRREIDEARVKFFMKALEIIFEYRAKSWAKGSVEEFFQQVYRYRNVFDESTESKIAAWQSVLKSGRQAIRVVQPAVLVPGLSANVVQDGRDERISTMHGSAVWSAKQSGMT